MEDIARQAQVGQPKPKTWCVNDATRQRHSETKDTRSFGRSWSNAHNPTYRPDRRISRRVGVRGTIELRPRAKRPGPDAAQGQSTLLHRRLVLSSLGNVVLAFSDHITRGCKLPLASLRRQAHREGWGGDAHADPVVYGTA